MAQGRRSILDVSVEDVEKRKHPSKHYVYIITVKWSDGSVNVIYRRYSKFFDFQVKLLDLFPRDSGKKNPAERIIPFLPGKIIFGRSHIREVALKRLDPINKYCRQLYRLPSRIVECEHVLNFFEPTDEDIMPPKDQNKASRVEARSISEPVLLDQYFVISDFTKQGACEINLRAGESVDVIEKNETGWWFVSGDEGQGWVPSSYLELRDGQEDNRSMENMDKDRPYVATNPYTLQYSDELSLQKGSVVKVLEKNLDGWWLISQQGKEGKVPANLLARTDTARAKHVMQALSQAEGSSSGNQSEDSDSDFNDVGDWVPGENRPPMVSTATLYPPEEEPVYMTISDFQNQAGDGISFREGVKVEVIEKQDAGWWYARIDQKEGWVPSAYIEKTVPPSASKPKSPKPAPAVSSAKPAPATVETYQPKTHPGLGFASELQNRLLGKQGSGQRSDEGQNVTRTKPLPQVPQQVQDFDDSDQDLDDDEWEDDDEDDRVYENVDDPQHGSNSRTNSKPLPPLPPTKGKVLGSHQPHHIGPKHPQPQPRSGRNPGLPEKPRLPSRPPQGGKATARPTSQNPKPFLPKQNTANGNKSAFASELASKFVKPSGNPAFKGGLNQGTRPKLPEHGPVATNRHAANVAKPPPEGSSEQSGSVSALKNMFERS